MAKKFTFESNIKTITSKIEATPEKVLNIIGQNIVKEIKTTIPVRTGKLQKSIGYWARKVEKDIIIGFYNNKHPKHKKAAFYSAMVYKDSDPIKPVILSNSKRIQQLIKTALDEIGKR